MAASALDKKYLTSILCVLKSEALLNMYLKVH